jgi:hypothetical protein
MRVCKKKNARLLFDEDEKKRKTNCAPLNIGVIKNLEKIHTFA